MCAEITLKVANREARQLSWGRVLLETMIVFQLVKIYSALYGRQKLMTVQDSALSPHALTYTLITSS